MFINGDFLKKILLHMLKSEIPIRSNCHPKNPTSDAKNGREWVAFCQPWFRSDWGFWTESDRCPPQSHRGGPSTQWFLVRVFPIIFVLCFFVWIIRASCLFWILFGLLQYHVLSEFCFSIMNTTYFFASIQNNFRKTHELHSAHPAFNIMFCLLL
jgi:hypothetical protein